MFYIYIYIYNYIYKTIYIKLLCLKDEGYNIHLEFASILIHVSRHHEYIA